MSAEPGRKLAYGAAMVEALAQSMREDPMVFVAGEDVGGIGGVFGNFRGLSEEFGTRRVVDTPIAESAIVGLGIGAEQSREGRADHSRRLYTLLALLEWSERWLAPRAPSQSVP